MKRTTLLTWFLNIMCLEFLLVSASGSMLVQEHDASGIPRLPTQRELPQATGWDATVDVQGGRRLEDHGADKDFSVERREGHGGKGQRGGGEQTVRPKDGDRSGAKSRVFINIAVHVGMGLLIPVIFL